METPMFLLYECEFMRQDYVFVEKILTQKQNFTTKKNPLSVREVKTLDRKGRRILKTSQKDLYRTKPVTTKTKKDIS